jgi:hypothetical protein
VADAQPEAPRIGDAARAASSGGCRTHAGPFTNSDRRGRRGGTADGQAAAAQHVVHCRELTRLCPRKLVHPPADGGRVERAAGAFGIDPVLSTRTATGARCDARGMRCARPCRVCRRWFQPDPRVGDRQHVCSSPSCQVARRKKTHGSWPERNPDYFVARRLKQRTAMAGPPPAPLRAPPPDRLPLDIAQNEFGVQGADFLGVFGRVLVGAAQDQRQAQVMDTS